MITLRASLAFLLLTGILALPWSGTMADPLWVIVRQDAPIETLSPEELANIFLGRWTGGTLVPVDRSESDLRTQFYGRLTGQSLNSVRAYWAKRVFTGRGRPPEALAEEAVRQALERTIPIVTYVPAGQKPADTKVILTLEEP